MTCTYTFAGPDGRSMTITGRPALKDYLAQPGVLDRLLPQHAEAAGFKRTPVASAIATPPEQVAMVKRMAEGMAGTWANPPKVEYFTSLQDANVPQAVRDADAEQRAAGAVGDPEGFYLGGKVYVSLGLTTPEAVVRVMAHEALGHYGLRGLFGKELDPILRQIIAAKSDEVKARKEMSPMEAAEEILADMAQTRPDLGFVKRAIAAVRTWLRQNVPGFASLRLSDAELIRNYILPARQFVESGGGPKGGVRVEPTFSRGKNDDMTNNDVVGNQGGRSADDTTPVPAKTPRFEISHAKMIERGADGNLSRAFERYIPLDALDGLEPRPSNNESDDGKYHKGTQITQPIEVKFDGDQNVYMVYSGNHRIAQARANGQTHILAFVEPDTTQSRDYIGPLANHRENPDAHLFSKQDANESTTPGDLLRKLEGTQVVDSNGAPLLVYHGSKSQIDRFDASKTIDGGLHFGSKSQASMRSSKILHPAYLYAENLRRSKDTGGDWKGKIASAKAAGYDGIVYLNRYEGVSKETVFRLHSQGLSEKLDRMSDAEFRRAVPEAEDSYIVFQPEQIKSATGNNGSYSPTNPDIRFNRAPATPSPAPAGLVLPEQGLLRKVQARIQDNNNRIKAVQDRITKVLGRSIPNYADYYMAEDNRPGRIAALLEDFREKIKAPFVQRIAKSGHTLDQVEELAHAMHAQERNESKGKLHQEDSDFFKAIDDHSIVGASGMSTGKANEIIAKYRGDTAIQRHVKDLQAIARAALDYKLATGYTPKDRYDGYVEAWNNYVPLKGDAEYGPKVKAAIGHGERDEHILENVMRDYELAVVAGERNLARQSLLQMVLQNPDSELWTVGVNPRGRYIAGQAFNVYKGNEKVGEFDSVSQAQSWVDGRTDSNSTYVIQTERGEFTVEKNGKPTAYFSSYSKAEDYISAIKEPIGKFEIKPTGQLVKEYVKPLQDNEIPVYVDGELVRIQINGDEKLAAQLRPMNQAQMGWVLEKLSGLNRYLSKIYTGYSPTFLITNPLRDMQTGTITMLGNYGAGMAAKAWAQYPSAMKALFQYAKNGTEPNSEMGKMLKEYRMNGGKTGASHMSDLEEQGKSLSRLYDDAYGAKAFMADGKPTKAAIVAGRKTILGMAHVFEVLNKATENSLRLALYVAQRNAGATVGESAQAAKNVTVNFDRKGSETRTLSALFLFFNPAVQGTANAMRALTQGEHKKQAWFAVGALAALGMLAVSAGVDDDEDRWLGEGWDTRSKKLVINIGGTKITVPLSLEFAPFYATGVAIEEARRGVSKPMDSAGRIISSFIDAYVPLKGLFRYDSDNKPMDAMAAGMPTVLRPGFEAATNRNVFGSKIVPENDFTKDRPDNLKMNRNTKGTPFDSAAQGIAAAGEAVGAGRYENGLSKVSPEMLKHWWRTYTGGLGSFIGDSVGLGKLALDDPKAIELADVPVVKAFGKAKDVSAIRGRFYEMTKEIRATAEEFKQAKKAGDSDAMDKILNTPSKADMIGLERIVTKTTQAAAKLRDEEVTINADKSLSLVERRAAIKELQAQEEDLYRAAIGAFK